MKVKRISVEEFNRKTRKQPPIIVYILILAWALLACSNMGQQPQQAQAETTTTSQIETIQIEHAGPAINRSTETQQLHFETYEVTAYCACEICCKGSADGINAAGTKPIEGRSVAADRSLPIGTRLWIEGIGERIVDDRGEAIKGKRLDIYFDSHQDALDFGRQWLEVAIIE